MTGCGHASMRFRSGRGGHRPALNAQIYALDRGFFIKDLTYADPPEQVIVQTNIFL